MSRGTRGRSFGSYIDINPNRSAPKRWKYLGLLVLAIVTALVVCYALTIR